MLMRSASDAPSVGAVVLLLGGATLLSAVASAEMGAPWLLLGIPVVLAGGLALLQSPNLGAAALALVAYTNVSEVIADRYDVPSVAKALYAVLIAAAVLRALTGRGRVVMPWGPIALVVAYAGIQALTTLIAEAPDMALQRATDTAKDALFGLMIVALVHGAGGLRLVVWAMLAGGGAIAAMSTFQVVTGNYAMDFGGLARAGLHQIVGQVDDYRITGPLDDPNFYAQTLVALVPLAFGRVAGREPPALKLLAACVLAVLTTAIVFTYSRGALLAVGCVTLAGIAILRPPARFVLPAALLLLAAAPLVPDSYVDRVQSIVGTLGESRDAGHSDESVEGRLNEAKAALSMFADHPVLGVGAWNYEQHFQRYNAWQHGENRREDRAAHSLYLQILAETGVVGVAAFGAILVSLWRSVRDGRRGFHDLGNADGVVMAHSIGLALVGYGICAIWLHIAWAQYFWALAGIAWALPGAVRREAAAGATGAPPADYPLWRRR